MPCWASKPWGRSRGSIKSTRSYLWGAHLSGTLDGLGGVHGLLQVTTHAAPATHHFCCYDGNGNVTALFDADNGRISAQYEYGPFGEPIRVSGTMGTSNPFRFSTKYTDDETDLVYYGYRYYSPFLGRWLSRDPLEEEGGENLFSHAANDGINGIDALGESPFSKALSCLLKKFAKEPTKEDLEKTNPGRAERYRQK